MLFRLFILLLHLSPSFPQREGALWFSERSLPESFLVFGEEVGDADSRLGADVNALWL